MKIMITMTNTNKPCFTLKRYNILLMFAMGFLYITLIDDINVVDFTEQPGKVQLGERKLHLTSVYNC